MRHLFLIGFMGTGKSTIATELSARLGRRQLEMDALLVEEAGMPISEVFEKYGETHFRDMETALVRRLCEETGEGAVVSCGGGAVLREENVAMMKSAGKIVLLTASPETILERVSGNNDRPVLNGHMNVEYIRELMEKRRACYEKAADVVVTTDGKSVAQICEEIELMM